MKKILFISIILLLYGNFFTGCKKDEEDPVIASIVPEVLLSFNVDGDPLEFDTIKYVNAAGNNYGVENFSFYLSAFEFVKTSGDKIAIDTVIFIDAKNNIHKSFNLPNLPSGNYKSLKFFIGVDSLHNIENGLPNTVENNNMTWPAPMGGGYHFIKLEGNFLENSLPYGFAMHLGRNTSLVTINLVKDFSLNSSSNKVNLKMNINEWFQNPYIYDFNVDGNYSMGDSAAMTKLTKNAVDVFTLN